MNVVIIYNNRPNLRACNSIFILFFFWSEIHPLECSVFQFFRMELHSEEKLLHVPLIGVDLKSKNSECGPKEGIKYDEIENTIIFFAEIIFFRFV